MEFTMHNNSSQNYEEFEIDPEMLIGGVKVNYYLHCRRQLWFFSKFITMEHSSDLVVIGKLIEKFSSFEFKRNIMIDNNINIDFVYKKDKLIVTEIKKSDKYKIIHEFQLLYYLWYLKNIKGVNEVYGLIRYPKLRKIEKVELTEEKEEKIKDTLKEIEKIVSLSKPPKVIKKQYCKNCSYYELCFA